ncbi:hypothetical protein AHAT_26160 [Agarivorans sp. Toyoura001]|uniref:RNA polymerase sigma factor n=1 Tax=Agarivorans sp. Toyoura001 TaxID=2283141 RepID=UPI0010E0FCF6|nr:sigma-70 family RNA polymerase sigma factor [Agarivorans sp. Toyoura001]GDY26726.1 hypothetical protein AHAT_26160 [Agarivorans sp. Toyoura001]
MKFVDQELVEKAHLGCNKSFETIIKNNTSNVRSIIYKELTSGRGDIYKQMMCGFENIIEDITNEVWIGLRKSINKGIYFEDEFSLAKVITTVCKNKTRTYKRKSVRNRKSTNLVGCSNKFISKDQVNHGNKSLAIEVSSVQAGIVEEAEYSRFDHYLDMISDSLTTRQKSIIKIMENGFLGDNKKTHKEVASELGISERTVRNELSIVRLLAGEKISKKVD